MRRVFGAFVVLVALLLSVPASAQLADDSIPAGPIVNSWYAGVNTGAAVVEKFTGAVGADAGLRVWKNLDGVAELFWTPNAATRRQLDNADRLADVVSPSGGTGSIKMPVTYVGVGARWVFENSGRIRPYALVTVGSARTNLKPRFAVDGADVTGSLASYGVTLGEDLAGNYSRFASEGGIGIVMGYGTWYLDGGARLLSINAPDQRINIARLVLGGGYRF